MRRGALWWGLVIIFFGVLFLLEALGIIKINVWGVIVPIFVIVLGAWILWGTLARRSVKTEHVNVSMDGASKARVHIRHGAGRLTVDAGAGQGSLLEGDCAGGAELISRRIEDTLEASLSAFNHAFSFGWWPEYRADWNLHLAVGIPFELNFDTGAADTNIDLSQLVVNKIRFNSGASSTRMTLPACAGLTTAEFKTGAASLELRIPLGVAARIQTSSGLSSIAVDKNRFPRSGGVYQSGDYDVAANKVDIRVEVGVGSVDIR